MDKEITSNVVPLKRCDNAMATALLYRDCCLKMGHRFKRLARKYSASGQLEMANKMEAEAVIQLDAWRKADRELNEQLSRKCG